MFQKVLQCAVIVGLVLSCIVASTMPVSAQASADVPYPEEPNVLAAAVPAQIVAVPEDNAENRVVNGVELRGLDYCAKYDGRTEWDANFVFPPISANTVVQMDASMWTNTVYEVKNTDAQTQSFNLLSRADITLQPQGMSQVPLFAERYLQNVVLETDEVISGTLSADKVEPRRTLAVTPSGTAFTVTVNAESRSELRGTTTNLDASYSNYAGGKVCLWYGQLPARMGDFTWKDADEDGIQDVGESPMPGVKVTWEGAESGSTTTGPDGTWGSPWLVADTYTVTFGTVVGYTSTISLQGIPSLDSNPRVSTVALNPGDVNLTIDHGFVGIGRIGDRCWNDANNNGRQDTGEPGVQGCIITVYECVSGKQVATTITDADGHWLVAGLQPGCYQARSVLPEGGWRYALQHVGDTTLDSNADRTSGDLGSTTLSVEGTMEDLTIDIGLLQDNDPYVATKSVSPTNGISGTVVTYTIRVGNNGPGTAYDVELDDWMQSGVQILEYPEACELVDGNDQYCKLADLPPGATATLTYTGRITTEQPLILVNETEIHARGYDLDKGNNNFSAVVHVNHRQKDGKPWYWYWMPIVDRPHVPEQPHQCQMLWNAVLNVETRGIHYEFPMANFYATEIHLPDGLDLPYLTPTRFWVTVEGISLTDLQFNWRQYDPFHRITTGMGLNEFIFAGGYPGEELDLEVTLYQWINSLEPVCSQGAEFEENIDP